MSSIRDQIRRVHLARQRAELARASVDLSKQVWEDDNKALIADSRDAAEGVTVAEAALREMALLAYAETGNKAPAPGVGIRVVARLDYDLRAALAWAKEHDMALSLDKRAFEKIADVQEIACVRKSEEATATIAGDLSRFVEAAVEHAKTAETPRRELFG